MPTISEGLEGLTDFSLPGVFSRSPAIRRSYSRPNSERTFANAASIACRLVGTEKLVKGSLRKSGIGFTRLEKSLLSLDLLYSCKCHIAVVPKTTEPLFPRSPGQPASLRVDALQRIQIEGGHPGWRQMRRGGNQVRKEAKGLAGARRGRDQHVPIVSGSKMQPDPGSNLHVAIQQFHPPRFDQRIVVGIDIADAVPRMVVVGVLPLAPARIVGRARKQRLYHAAVEARIPSAMVPMQVSIDDDIDPVRIDAMLRDQLGERVQVCGQLHPVPRPVIHLISTAGFDQRRVFSGFDQVTVKRQANQIALVGRHSSAPEAFWNDAEERSAVPMVHTRPHEGDTKVTHRNTGHRMRKTIRVRACG